MIFYSFLAFVIYIFLLIQFSGDAAFNKTLENKTWEKYGVVVVNEQTAYTVPGNSHTSREGSAELQYVSLTGDTSRKQNAIRQLNWATYMVDYDGKNRYPQDENWLTDGYGDYVRHFLRAMGAMPELAPSDEEHILFSSSVVQEVEYKNRTGSTFISPPDNPEMKDIKLRYTTYDKKGTETIHLLKKPSKILVGGTPVSMSDDMTVNSYKWQAHKTGGILIINRVNGNEVIVMG